MEELEMELTITVKVQFYAKKAERMTRHYPGCPAHIEIEEIILPSPDEVAKEFEDEITEACWDEVRDNAQAEAEARFEAMREEKMLRGL